MSRLIVKGLPPRCTENQLRQFYKNYGTITDCSLKFTKDGKFRGFAFVGFENADNCSKAISNTHSTYFGSSSITVEECKPFGDESKPRAWSKYSSESSAFKRANEANDSAAATKKSNVKNNPTNSKDKPQIEISDEFGTFLEAKGVSVETDKKPVESVDDETNREVLKKEVMAGITGDTKLSLLVSGLPCSMKQKHLKEWFAPVRVKALKGAASFVSFDKSADVRRALQKSGQFLGGFKVTIEKVGEVEKDSARVESDGGQPNGASREVEEAKIRDAILESGRLFLRNLPFSTTEEDLRAHLKPFGEVASVQVIVAKSTGKCKGFALVDFVFPENAVAAYAALDATVFKGRMLHIIAGQEKREEKTEESSEKTSFKKDKALKQKKGAATQSHSWNALFLGANAVADSLAEKLGVQKSDILSDGGDTSAAVRLALAETTLVRQTRQFLLDSGVRLDAFSRPAAKRSDTVILVKNLPAGVQREELERLFDKFGGMEKVLIPPEGGVSALIVYSNNVDAKKAFQALAYARFRTQPLYLEWAPADVFEGEKKSEEEREGDKEDIHKTGDKKKKRKGELSEEEKKEERKSKRHKGKEITVDEKEENDGDEQMEASSAEKVRESGGGEEEEEKGEEEATEEVEDGSLVFVKNLSFNTTDEALHKLFSNKFKIESAKVSRKFNASDPSTPLSMGFAFVQFYTKEDAEEAMKTMQGTLLDGHCLELKLSNRQEQKVEGKKRKEVSRLKQGDSTKIMVRNLPFQSSAHEVEALFVTFGGVKGVRMPKKVGASQHRGFAFVDFTNKGDAKRAFDALVHSTHLYGRRLVLEWAKGEEDSINELRERTASRFTGTVKEQRKLKKRMEAIEKDLKVIDDD